MTQTGRYNSSRMAERASSTSASAYLYLLYGEDEFSRSEQVAALREKMRLLPAGEHNLTTFDGSTATVREVLGACQVTPFLADRRMVVVQGLLGRLSGASKFRSGRSRKRSGAGATAGEELDELLEALPHLPPTTALVLVEGALDDQLVSRFTGPRAIVRRFDPPRGERLVRWLKQRARAHGAELDDAAARALSAETDDLRRLDGELAKLAAFCQGRIDVEAVRVLVAGAEAGIFSLLDAVAEGRRGEAIAALRSLFEQGQRSEAVVAQLASLLRRLLIVKELSRGGVVSAAQAAAHGLNPNALPKLQRQARGLSPPQLEHALERLLEGDRASKTGTMDPETAVELVVAELAGAARRAVPTV